MTAVWKRVVDILLSLLIPPLSDKESHAEPPSPQEVTVVFQWLKVGKLAGTTVIADSVAVIEIVLQCCR